MRLKKLSLIAAAGLASTVGAFAATATADLDGNPKTFGSNIAVATGSILTIDVDAGATWAGKITGRVQNPGSTQPILDVNNTGGNVVKTGAGTLQIDSYKDMIFYQGSFILGQAASQVMMGDATQGTLRVRDGTVEVGGYINQYVVPSQFGSMTVGMPLSPDGFLGYSSTVLEGDARLSFSNTRLNVANGIASLDGTAPDDPPLPRVKRLNFVVNLKAGDADTEVNTRLNVGQTEDMRLVTHVTPGTLGSVGILEGQGGRLLKTGTGEFILLNRATYTGDIVVAGGTLTAGAANAIGTVRSVNFASPVSLGSDRNFDPEDLLKPDQRDFSERGRAYTGFYDPRNFEFQPTLAPLPEDSPVNGGFASMLRLQGDQTIRNLQSLFNTNAPDETYGIGKASGSAIDIEDGRTLVILQDSNGYYAGKFTSGATIAGGGLVGAGGGNIVKLGASASTTDSKGNVVYTKGTLALLGGTSTFRSLDVREGVVIVNAQSLGTGVVTVGNGTSLQFVQNDIGTLNAVLRGLGGITFSRRAFMMNNGPTTDNGFNLNDGGFPAPSATPVVTQVGNGQFGTVDIAVAQDSFAGDILVRDGLQLRFGVVAGEAFRFANSLTLLAGAGGEESALTFNNTNQTFRNFSGEKRTRIDLGQGNITLVQESANVIYEGKIGGTGGFIKDGSKTFTLSGRDEIGNSVATYAGATVVKAGALNLAGANQLPNTSGLVLVGGTLAMTGDQRFGALFGGAGSKVEVGGAVLTIGLSDLRLAQIQSGAAQLPLPANNSYYLASEGSASVAGFTGATTRAFLASVYYNPQPDYAAARVAAAKTAFDAAVLAAADAASTPGDATKVLAAAAAKDAAIQAARSALVALNGATTSLVSAKDADARKEVATKGKTATDALNAMILAGQEDMAASGAKVVAAVTASNAYASASNTAAQDTAVGLAFAGEISGAGRALVTGGPLVSLIKEGAERLILSGKNTYTGSTLVNGGTLQINLGSIDASSSVTVGAGANFAVNVDTGASGVFSRKINGAGNFEKVGAGALSLGSDVVGYTGTTTVSGGTLALTLKPSIAGTISIATGATLTANQPVDLTYGTAVTGTGTFRKEGAGTLHLTNVAGSVLPAIAAFTGGFVVSAGTLQVGTLDAGTVNVGSGATFLFAPTAPVSTYSGSITGAGTFAVSGLPVTFAASNATFTGTLSGTNTTILAGVNDIFPNAAIVLTNSTFDLDGTSQKIAGFTGDSSSVVNLASGQLHFAPAVGVTASFDGQINGSGSIFKDGPGTQILTTPIDTGWTGFTIVNEGVLSATTLALGASAVTINAPGTLAFLNGDVENASTYFAAITGTGVIGKTGAGVVNLANASNAFTGSIAISQGELHVTSAGIGGSVFGSTTAASGGTYAVAMDLTNTVAGVLTHDATLVGNHVSDAAAINGVTQHGSLAVEGDGGLGNFTLRLANGQSYTGNTILRSAATLDLSGSGLATLNGLAGDAGTRVITGGTPLTIAQSLDGVYAGDFDASTDLTVTAGASGQAGKLSLTNSANNIANITLASGGRLALDAALTNTVTLSGGSTLYFDTSVNNQVYAGTVTGTGNILKTGTGTLTISDTSAFQNNGTIGVDQGRLNVTINATSIGSNITGLRTEGQGELGLLVASGDNRKVGFGGTNLAISGPGNLVKTGDGTLFFGDAANPYTVASTGALIIEQGTLGGTFSTSGDLTVSAADGIASHAVLAPGNSPGTVTVNGNLTVTNGTLALEMNATTSDLIKVTGGGNATLGVGTKFRVIQEVGGTAPVRGRSYTVLTVDAPGGLIAQEGDFTLDTSTVAGTAGRKALIVTPGRNADTNGALFGMGAANAIVLYDVGSLANLAGYTPHEGLTGTLLRLDDVTVDETGKPVGGKGGLGAKLFTTPVSDLSRVVNALSPLGYASLYAMSRDTALRQEDRIADRLEQRRYDRAGYTVADWEAFVVGSAAMVKNTAKSDTPVFDYNTYGGMVGLDKKVEDTGLVIGGAAGYDNGTSTLHDNAGKIEMNRVRGTAFLSTMVSSRWYVEGGLSAGFGDFSAKRDTLTGRNTGSTTGFDIGANVRTGTVVVLAEDLHLTPFVGVSYAHHEFQGFTEKGADSALKLNGWSQDSLRASVGSGLGWWLPAGDWKWKLGVDTAFNHELLDTDSDIEASFVNLAGAGAAGGKFSTRAAALPADSISVGPNAALHFDEMTSVSAGVTFEYGFDGRTFTGINVAFRRRF